MSLTGAGVHRTGLRRWMAQRLNRPSLAACLVLVTPMVVLWSLATPTLGAGDDAASLFTSAAVVRGQFGGALHQTYVGKFEQVRVPGRVAALDSASACLQRHHDRTPSSCPHPPRVSDRETTVLTQFNRYPPLPYLIAGLPTLALHGGGAYWGATLLMALINGFFLSLGLWIALAFLPGRAAPLGVLVALTPEVLYYSGTVNASGFEIASGLATWSALIAVALAPEPPRRLVVCAAGTGAALAMARPLGPVWLGFALVCAGVLAGGQRLRALARRGDARIALAVLVAAGLSTVGWRIGVGDYALITISRPPHPVSFWGAIRETATSTERNYVGEIGTFFGVTLPYPSLVLFLVPFTIVLIAGVSVASRRALIVIAAIVGVVVFMPLLVQAVEYNRYGIPWEAKDGVPVSVGLLILAASLVPSRLELGPQVRRVWLIAVACIAACSIVTFVFVLHRYTAGVDGTWNPIHQSWQPIGGFLALSLLFAAWTIFLVVMVSAWMGRSGSSPPIDLQASQAPA